MSELEDLPSWAGRLTREVELPQQPEDPPAEAEAEATSAGPETPPADAEAPPAAAEAAPVETADLGAPQTPPSGPTIAAERPGLAPRVAADPQATVPQADVPLPPAIDPEPAPQPPTLPETPPLHDQDATQPVVTPALEQARPPEPADEMLVGAPASVMTAPRRRSPMRTILFALLGLAILAGAGFGGYLLANLGDGEETATTGADDNATTSTSTDPAADDAASSDVATDDGSGATATEAGTADEGGDGAEDATEDATNADPQTVTVDVGGADETAGGDTEAPMNDGDRQAFFRGGKVYLTGAVPSEEVAALIVQKAAAVVGPDNVVNEYTIDPTTTINPGDSAPLYVEDVILFEFNSVAVAQPFLPILDLGVLLLSQNPQASITVVTRTDAVGSAEVNLEVAQQRADAVIRYWLSRGVDRDQIKADPRGEEGASEDDDPETAARQRRAEFIITGLLD